MNQKLGLDPAFLNESNPFELFKIWMSEAEKSEPNDPNAFNIATVDQSGQPDNRIVLTQRING
jgi:pyridoxamine 5'-phosphate oxidase